MTTLISGGKSALDVHLNGTIGTFRVSSEDGKSAGVEVRYLLTHVTLSEKQGHSPVLTIDYSQSAVIPCETQMGTLG